MENLEEKSVAKVGAYTTLFGSICMLSGAAMFGASGVDLDQALYDNNMAGYLKDAFANQNLLIANLSIWIAGVMLLGIGANMMALLSPKNPVIAHLVRYNYAIAVPLVTVAYLAWLGVVVRLAGSGSPEAATIAEAVGWFGVRADWVATVLVLGTGPLLISTAGKGNWVPNWLRVWSIVAFFTGILNVFAQFAGGLTTYGFIIIPVGMGWMIGAAIVLLRKSRLM